MLQAIKQAWLLLGYGLLAIIAGNWIVAALLVPVSMLHERWSTRLEFSRGSPAWKNHPASDIDGFIANHERLMRRLTLSPYTGYKSKPFESPDINVTDGSFPMRVTLPRVAGRLPEIFVFGGSTVWGYGVPDGETIPSFLQRKVGSEFRVTNHGELAFVSAQDFHLFAELLASGEVPKVAVFYEGYNDLVAPALGERGDPRAPLLEQSMRLRLESLWFRVLESTYYGEFAILLATRSVVETSRARWVHRGDIFREKVAANFETHVRMTRALAEDYGVETLFYWQPTLLSSSRRGKGFEYEDLVLAELGEAAEAYAAAEAYLRSRLVGREEEGIIYLGDVFDDVHEPLYFDLCHVNPRGNEIVADRIYDAIVARVHSSR